MRPLAALAPAVALGLALPAMAQQVPAVTTHISPDTGALSLGTQVSRAGRTYTIDGGTRAGPNVFHSFSQFDLGRGDTAHWTWTGADRAGIANIVSRVTGGTPSTILGTISTVGMPNADFWFVNPAGIVFGEGAVINVPAAAHFASARQLSFSDGISFGVMTPGGSTFSIGFPEDYGFVGGEGSISLAGLTDDLLAQRGRSLSLVASDISIAHSFATAGKLQLLAAGSGAKDVSVGEPEFDTLSGKIGIDDSRILFSGRVRDGRGFLINGGTVAITGRSSIGTVFSEDPANNATASISIMADSFTLDSSGLDASATGGEPGGAVTIEARQIRLTGAIPQIKSTSNTLEGPPGLILLSGDDISIEGNAFLQTTADGAQRGGDILIQGGKVAIDQASIYTQSEFGATGDAGTISITGKSVTLSGGTELNSSTYAFGNGGSVVIDVAGPLTIRQTSITSQAGDETGNGGTISIHAGAIDMSENATIRTATATSGDGGTIDITSDALSLHSATITAGSEPQSTGRPGSIAITTGALTLDDASQIESASRSPATAGRVTIAADSILVDGQGSSISSANELGGTGDAGSVSVATRALSLVEGGTISTSADSGAAGDISISMPRDGLLWLVGRGTPSEITTSSGPGTGGRILIAKPRAILSDGGSILALGQQGGANVRIQTDFFINSADRPNRVAVNGFFLLDAQVGDVSSGTVERNLSILDASGVLRGQCAATRATGQVSQLVIRPTGPYAPLAPPFAHPPATSCR